MSNDFVYTTYIKSTPEKVWQAITTAEFTRQYWGRELVSDWKVGSEWKMQKDGDSLANVVGRVIESTPPHRLTLSWAEPDNLPDESQVSFEIESVGGLVRLHVVHDHFKPGSDMQGKVTMGWSLVLSSMKSFLETGNPIDIMAIKTCSTKAA